MLSPGYVAPLVKGIEHQTPRLPIGAVLRHRCIESTAHYAKVDVALLQLVTQPWPIEGELP